MTTNHKTALVTGATRGIGREVVRQLLEQGYRVIATGRSRNDLESLKAEAASSHLSIATVDLESTDLETQVQSAIGDNHLDLLVANAARFAAWDEVASSADLTNAEAVMQVNLFGTWRVIQAALPALRRGAHSAIIAVGSGSGSHGDPQFGLATNPGAVSYAVSKAALHALMRKLAAELKGSSIRVWSVDPGLTATSPGMEDFGARPVADGAASVLAPLTRGVRVDSLTRDGHDLPW